MLSLFLSYIATHMLYLALHLESSSFPKPLSAKEEQECFEKMHKGDREARDKLIRHNLRLVAHIIKKYYAGATEQEDLISIGTIGLVKAVGSFDYNRGARFATYAAKCVENAILT
ncbi:MAG: sigma-70 family RNA polymerase sigma factor [Oscillospiraceae bacterium]|nr:sigma-70 family RNA polymerase sigma factor [Oscillospiraceae bacterium]